MADNNNFGLIGKLLITSDVRVITGLRIGGASGGLKIGGVDLNVITDPTGKPYIPGSSIKGKLRSLFEKRMALTEKEYFDPKSGQRKIKSYEEYENCLSSRIFGNLLKDKNVEHPTLTRLYVRDVYLDEESIRELQPNIDLPYTEVKFETAIDRLRGTAASGSLRQIERVPAGAVFRDLEMVFNIYLEEDKNLLKHFLPTLRMLEDDYLGGMGSRGYGKIKFENLKLVWNNAENYKTGKLPGKVLIEGCSSVEEVVKSINGIIAGMNGL